jgi:hypothetical protein
MSTFQGLGTNYAQSVGPKRAAMHRHLGRRLSIVGVADCVSHYLDSHVVWSRSNSAMTDG